jgi:two-component system, chemotaxis family, sensor kinase CheA
MFISVKRHEREKQELLGASNRLTEAILKSSSLGLFLLDAKTGIQPQVSKSLGVLFRRQDFAGLTFDKLLSPLVSAKTLNAARMHMARLAEVKYGNDEANPLDDVEVRLANGEANFDTAHYSFHFTPIDDEAESRSWLVRVTDITARVQQQRELEDLRTNLATHAEILRGVLQAGGARLASFLQKTDASMKSINTVLKKPAREADAFRSKLEETLVEVDRVRREAAALKLSGLEAAARHFEDALQDLRGRSSLSGSDFLPLAVKLDQLFTQFALIRSLTTQASARAPVAPTAADALPLTEGGTEIIEAPRFIEQHQLQAASGGKLMAAAGSLDSTLSTLTELVAQEHHKTVVLESVGLDLVPPRFQATIKNVAIQLIRNAVMHGIETPAERETASKPVHGTLQLEFRSVPGNTYELLFQDDGRGIDPDRVRRTAIAKGIVDEEAAARLRDRQAIKLIFKSGYTTLEPEGDTKHGAGMSLVRRYVHEAGGKIALASLLGHETRFKVTLPSETPAAQVA